MVAVPPALPSIKSVDLDAGEGDVAGSGLEPLELPVRLRRRRLQHRAGGPGGEGEDLLGGRRLAEDEPEPERVGVAHEVVRDGRAGRLQVERDEPERVLVDAELDGSADVRAGRHGRVGNSAVSSASTVGGSAIAAQQPPVS